jgi:hypothetical protein
VRRRDALLAAGAAWAGLILGHGLTYLLAYPGASDRQVHLLATGHRWLGPAILSLGAAIPAVLVVAAARAVRTGRAAPRRLLPWLALAQVSAFLAIEVAERGLDLAGALGDPAVLLGVVVQVAVAAAAWLVFAAVSSVVATVAGRSVGHHRAAARASLPGSITIPRSRATLLVRARRRAPPASLPA